MSIKSLLKENQNCSQHDIAAVGPERLSGVVARGIRSQEDRGRRDLIRLAHSAQRQWADVVDSGLAGCARDDAGVDWARGNAVDEDPAWSHFARQALAEADDARLRGGIVRESLPTDLTYLRGDVDDPPLAALQHARQDEPRHQECPAQMGGDHVVP